MLLDLRQAVPLTLPANGSRNLVEQPRSRRQAKIYLPDGYSTHLSGRFAIDKRTYVLIYLELLKLVRPVPTPRDLSGLGNLTI